MFWRTIGGMVLVFLESVSFVGIPLLVWTLFEKMEEEKGIKAFLSGLGAFFLLVIWLAAWILDGYQYDMTIFG